MENKNQGTQLPSPEISQLTQEPTLPVAEKPQQDAPKKDGKIL
ncbi:unnamed protein product, partial [marine sediment metagenome]